VIMTRSTSRAHGNGHAPRVHRRTFFAEDSWRNVYAGELVVRPAFAPVAMKAVRRLVRRSHDVARVEARSAKVDLETATEGKPPAAPTTGPDTAAPACRYGRVELVELYLERGADPVESDAEPWATPTAWAAKMGHDNVLKVLRKRGH
jgi:hypothetical protein